MSRTRPARGSGTPPRDRSTAGSAPTDRVPGAADGSSPNRPDRGTRWWYVLAVLPALWAVFWQVRWWEDGDERILVVALAIVAVIVIVVGLWAWFRSAGVRGRFRAARRADPTAVVFAASGDPTTGAALADLWHDPGAHAVFAKPFVVVVDSFGVRLLPGRGAGETDRLVARRDLRGVESGVLGVAERPTPVAELTVHTQDGRIVLVPLVLTNDGAGGQRPTASFVRRAVGEIKARAGIA